MPFLTVMIPVYNGERYVAQAIESVLMQPCRDLEVLILDDGSTDGTARIGEHYAQSDDRVRYVSHPNIGLGENRNRGFNLVEGQWLIFLDHDDVMVPGIYTANLQRILQRCAENNIEMIVNARLRGDEHFSSFILDPLRHDGVVRGGGPTSWTIPYELATNLYKTSLIAENTIRFARTRPEMESVFRHQCAYLARKILFCKRGFIEIRRDNPTQITKNWDRCAMRAVRLVEYAKLPQWHRNHGAQGAAIATAYRLLSRTIVDFFSEATASKISLDSMTEILREHGADGTTLHARPEYSWLANRFLSLYANGRVSSMGSLAAYHTATCFMKRVVERLLKMGLSSGRLNQQERDLLVQNYPEYLYSRMRILESE